MAQTIKLIAVLIFSLQIIACQRPVESEGSCNFVQNSNAQRISWGKHLPIRLYLHESVPVEAYGAIERAVRHYNERLGAGREIVRIEGRGVSGELNPQKDGFSVIYWYTNWDPTRNLEQARTTVYWSGSEIFEADMRINSADFRYSFSEDAHIDGVDLESIMVHEIGHVFGLAHNVSHGSAMNSKLEVGENRRQLGAVDLASLKCEY